MIVFSSEKAPDVVLVQEMNGRVPYRLQQHLRRTANHLAMTPLPGPPLPGSASGNHPALLIRTTGGLQILDTGPPPFTPAALSAAWCQAEVAVPGLDHPVQFISVHLPPRSATRQHIAAEQLATLIATRGGHTVAGGDWNSYAPADPLTTHALAQLPARLHPARMQLGPGGHLEPDYHVHHVLASAGLADAAAELPAGRRTPPPLTPTSTTGGARIDRIYLTPGLIPALERYEQAATGGSDHHALLLTFRTEQAHQ